MSLEGWLLFCVTETVLCFTPGPAVLLVVSLSLARGAQSGFRASLGILAANALYFLLSATSIGALLLASWEVFFLVKWVGAAYLIWLGIRMIVAASKPGSSRADPEAPPQAPRIGAFANGFLTQGANPKALVFFSALLLQFIDPQGPVAPQVAILGVSSVLIELLVLAIYVVACHRVRGLARHPRFAAPQEGFLTPLMERAGGLLLIGAGAGLAAIRRN